MPSISQIEEGGPVLTNFTALQKKSNLDNEHFQNGVEYTKHQNIEKFEVENKIYSERNGNHIVSNGNGTTESHMNGNGYLNGNSNMNGKPHINEEKLEASMKNGLSNGHHVGPVVTDKKEFHTAVSTLAPTDAIDNKNVDPSLAWKHTGKEYKDGPDQILPSDALRTWHQDGAIKLSTKGEGEIARAQPMSVPSLLERATRRAPEKTALAVKRNGEWQKWTYREYLNDVRTIAKGFIALGLERYHSVCILGFNTPEWFISDIAAIYAGGFAAGIYTTNTPEACAFVAQDSKANIFVVEDDKQLAKILEIRDQLPHLKAIVQYTGEPEVEGVYSWTKVMMLGQQQDDTVLEERLKKIAINQCCTLIYTSGTTGNPKGVMLSHDNLVWTAFVNKERCRFQDFVEEYISFLPLSHVAAQIADIYCPLTVSATVFFADKNALKGSLVETMKEVKPTKFLAVPRVWEKMYEKMQEIGRSTKGVKKAIATWAKAKGLEYNMKRMNGDPNPESLGFKIANKLILSKIRDALGLTRCDLHLSAAAPISPEILKYFWSLNIVVTEAYGMSECTGPHCVGVETEFRMCSVGRVIPGAETKLGDPDADGNGEVLMGGRHVGMGYLQQPQKTIDAIDDEGWLHSEDIGKVDKDGFLFITGRIKELLITAGGENVAPVPIEDNIKTALPIVSQAVVIGDRLKFLSVLLTFKTEVDKETQEPLDELTSAAKAWIKKKCDCKIDTIQEVRKELYENRNQKLINAIQEGIDESNTKAVSNAQKIQKWVVLSKDFSIPGGELGPTLKLKRKTVYEIYKHTIEELYK